MLFPSNTYDTIPRGVWLALYTCFMGRIYGRIMVQFQACLGESLGPWGTTRILLTLCLSLMHLEINYELPSHYLAPMMASDTMTDCSLWGNDWPAYMICSWIALLFLIKRVMSIKTDPMMTLSLQISQATLHSPGSCRFKGPTSSLDLVTEINSYVLRRHEFTRGVLFSAPELASRSPLRNSLGAMVTGSGTYISSHAHAGFLSGSFFPYLLGLQRT